MADDEKTLLLGGESDMKQHKAADTGTEASWVQWTTGALTGTLRLVISAVLSPGRWLIACFYDDCGNFSMAMPLHRIGRKLSRRQRKSAAQAMQAATSAENKASSKSGRRHAAGRPDPSVTTGSSVDDRSDFDISGEEHERDEAATAKQRSRSRATGSSLTDDSDSSLRKPSIRIREAGSDALKQRKHRPQPMTDAGQQQQSSASPPALTVDNIKSPRSPTSSLSIAEKYPRAPAPPRPLVPRRQPSYTFKSSSFSAQPQKTLVIDLDETLIHSQARGGRMSTGHMVEVKINSPVGAGGQVLAPQVPILYHVHKRPYCDEFLRKVSKWYNLVAFTASVQEYADPVIDWLELERKYFSGRYYRQHCTYRQGAYIKDLGIVEPDLSKVIILDNSAFSFLFHEDNAIPIEGWISDPTDRYLEHLIPFLEGLQHATDVRALLALRLGEASAAAS